MAGLAKIASIQPVMSLIRRTRSRIPLPSAPMLQSMARWRRHAEACRALAVFLPLSLLLGCSDVGVSGAADVTLFRWPGHTPEGKELVIPSHTLLIDRSWLAEDIRSRGVIDNAQMTITFDAEGRVAGSGGCNRYFGPVTIGGNTIRFGNLASTKMACTPALMDQEQTFFDALAATRSYRLDDGGETLVFLDENGGLLIRFRSLTP